jgi:hypothetical protein
VVFDRTLGEEILIAECEDSGNDALGAGTIFGFCRLLFKKFELRTSKRIMR